MTLQIYTLSDDRHIYVGLTINLARRIRTHVNDARRGRTTPCATWLRQLLARGRFPRVETVFATNDAAVASVAERLWVSIGRAHGYRILNAYAAGYVPTFAHRWALSTALRNRNLNTENTEN